MTDGEHAYVGAANLTSAGFGRHVELGIVVEGAEVKELTRLLLGLSRLGQTHLYPPAPAA